MWQKLKFLWSPPVFEDADETQTARILHGILWGVFGLMLFMSPLLALSNVYKNSQWFSLGMDAGLLCGLFGLNILLRRGNVRWVSYFLVGMMFVGVLPFYFLGHNLILLAIEQIAIMGLAILILDVRAFTWLGIASVVVYGFGILFHLYGNFYEHPHPPEELLNALIAFFMMGAILFINRIALKGLHQSLARTHQSEARARALLEAVPDLMFRVDQHGVFLDCQNNDEHTFLISPDKFLGKSVDEVLPMLAEVAQSAIQKTLALGKVETLEYQLKQEHALRFFEARFVKSGSKEVTVIVRDMTKQKKAENLQREQENEIRKLNADLEQRVSERTAALAVSNEALRQSELRYQMVTELISEYAYSAYLHPMGHLVVDWLTPSIEKVTGYSPTEFIEQGGWDHILYPEDRAYDASLEALALEGTPISGEVRIVTKAGAIRWVQTTAHRELDAEGARFRLIGVVTDIHDKKKIELALRDSEAKLRTLFDLLPVGVTLLNADKKVQMINPALKRLLDIDASQVFGDQYLQRQYFRADGTPMPVDEYVSERVFAQAHPIYDEEIGVMKNDGAMLWAIVNAAPLPDGGVVVVTSDISARKKAELRQNLMYETLHRVGTYLTPAEVLGAAVETISHLNDWASVTIVTPDSDGTMWTVRTSAGEEERQDAAHVIEQGLSGRTYHTAQIQLSVERMQASQPCSEIAVPIKNRERVLGVLNIKNKGPSCFSSEDLTLVESLADVVALGLDNAFLYESLQNELTERGHAELRLIAANAELARSNIDLERFAYAVSHDLQEPLRQVMQFSQLLYRLYQNKLDQDAEEMLEFIVEGANRMHTMVKGLLDYSRLGRSNQNFALVDCNLVFARALNNVKLSLEENAGTVTCDVLPSVLGNEVLLEMLFQNLLANAIKFRGAEPPHIHVFATREEGKVMKNGWVIGVSDNGIGISPDYFERIFVIFQRLHTREEYPGTGLGLALCKRILELHGGQIWVESQEGQGSTFFFSLPAEPI